MIEKTIGRVLLIFLRYEYVKNFERDEILLPNTWIVVRIDGRGFHQYVDKLVYHILSLPVPHLSPSHVNVFFL